MTKSAINVIKTDSCRVILARIKIRRACLVRKIWGKNDFGRRARLYFRNDVIQNSRLSKSEKGEVGL